MVEPEKPLKRKDQIMINEEFAKNLEAQMQAELEEEEKGLARLKEEETNTALIAEWDNTSYDGCRFDEAVEDNEKAGEGMKSSWQWHLFSSGSGNHLHWHEIFLAMASLFFWQWEPSSLAVGSSYDSVNFIAGSGNALCILFPIILP
nr:hypothetical protein [Tanacetum cinerariifolium]